MEFLRKYLTLSRCDLYFCDKAILVEGAAERLLIPDMIKKCERYGKFKGNIPSLSSQYCSIIEVGGAYAHRFFGFVDFLEIPTLILTNINFDETEGKKTGFALDLIFGEIADSYSIPSYIENGLIWLNEQSKFPAAIEPRRKFKRTYIKKK